MSVSPGTPESLTPSLPSFALSTPDGTWTSTVQTPSPAGSPLTPLQFIRRSDVDQAEISLSSLALSTHLSKSSTPSRPTRPRRSTTKNQAKVVQRPWFVIFDAYIAFVLLNHETSLLSMTINDILMATNITLVLASEVYLDQVVLL